MGARLQAGKPAVNISLPVEGSVGAGRLPSFGPGKKSLYPIPRSGGFDREHLWCRAFWPGRRTLRGGVMMMNLMAKKGWTGLALVMALLVWSGCSRTPRPVVQNFDSYETIQIGPVSYVTGQGTRVSATDRGWVQHEVDSIPGATFQVQVKTDPPRNFRYDADLERRRFQRAVPNGRWTSAQYHSRDGRENMRINVQGLSRKGERVYGALNIVRKDGQTAIVSAMGPMEHRDEIARTTARLAKSLEL